MYGSRFVINNTNHVQNAHLINGMIATIKQLQNNLREDMAKHADFTQVQLDLVAIHSATKKVGSDRVYSPWWLSIANPVVYLWCLIITACALPASAIRVIFYDD